jgi:hypothetical protein
MAFVQTASPVGAYRFRRLDELGSHRYWTLQDSDVDLLIVPDSGWRPAWINDLQRGELESGVFIGSPGSPSVD